MHAILKAKFDQNPDLCNRLVRTGICPIIAESKGADVFWGIDAQTGDGENHLGEILMQVRKELADAN